VCRVAAPVARFFRRLCVRAGSCRASHAATPQRGRIHRACDGAGGGSGRWVGPCCWPRSPATTRFCAHVLRSPYYQLMLRQCNHSWQNVSLVCNVCQPGLSWLCCVAMPVCVFVRLVCVCQPHRGWAVSDVCAHHAAHTLGGAAGVQACAFCLGCVCALSSAGVGLLHASVYNNTTQSVPVATAGCVCTPRLCAYTGCDTQREVWRLSPRVRACERVVL
jgi:hypothetical protein